MEEWQQKSKKLFRSEFTILPVLGKTARKAGSFPERKVEKLKYELAVKYLENLTIDKICCNFECC